MINRRSFLASILAAGVAPAAVGSGILMPVRKIIMPEEPGGITFDLRAPIVAGIFSVFVKRPNRGWERIVTTLSPEQMAIMQGSCVLGDDVTKLHQSLLKTAGVHLPIDSAYTHMQLERSDDAYSMYRRDGTLIDVPRQNLIPFSQVTQLGGSNDHNPFSA